MNGTNFRVDLTDDPATVTAGTNDVVISTLNKSSTKEQIMDAFKTAITTKFAPVYAVAKDAAKMTLTLTKSETVATAADPTATTVSMFEGGLKIQVGAEEGNQLNVAIDSMSSKSLGLEGVSISSQANAGNAITKTRDAINRVSEQRAAMGAMQNRMEHKISNLDNTAENLQAAESRIRDVDIAKEMTSYTKNNILSQAATAMLAQANAAPQSVLNLLR